VGSDAEPGVRLLKPAAGQEPERHAAERAHLWSLLGDRPQERGAPGAELLGSVERGEYRLERLRLELNGSEPVPALFVRPPRGDGPWPTVLYNHSHGGHYDLGKRELVDGVAYLQPIPYAVELARRGIAALAIDHWGFGERGTESELRIHCNMLWRGQVMWGMMCHDSLRAVDYLLGRDDVDGSRIATLGMSMGSTMAWWMAALDPRIAACVDICCLTEFGTFLAQKGFHAPSYYVPSLLKHFGTADINRLIAPRPHLSLAGVHDPLTPAAGLDLVDAALTDCYGRLGCPERWRLLRYPVAHEETPEMRAAALEFLERTLR
jgi:dienelactone hydrolase